MTTVVVVDDHPIVLQGCRRMLEDAGVEVILEARDAITGYKLCRRHRPDVAIVDLAMQDGGLSGLPLIPAASGRTTRGCASWCSACTATRSLSRARSRPVPVATCSKTPHPPDFLKAFKAVIASGAYLSHDLALQVALVRTSARMDPLAQLTPRELQTLSLLAKGKPYGHIADELSVSYKTVVNLSSSAQAQARGSQSPRAHPRGCAPASGHALLIRRSDDPRSSPIAKTSRSVQEKHPDYAAAEIVTKFAVGSGRRSMCSDPYEFPVG